MSTVNELKVLYDSTNYKDFKEGVLQTWKMF